MAAPDTIAAPVDVILAIGGGGWRIIRRVLSQEGRYWVALRIEFRGKRRNKYNPRGKMYILIGFHIAASFWAKKYIYRNRYNGLVMSWRRS